jgi:uncharacterized Zn finger protein
MARWSDGGWFPYVPVAERRKMAAREMEKLRKKGHPVAPVTLEGRTIVKTFWGKAWCDNLESYRDYENRLPRGRTYVRNGAVIDLQISALEVKALVSGSSIYKVAVTIKALAPTLWRPICEDCTGGIDSLVELLQGRFSKGVMERICRQDRGLFPKPSEIRFSCTCPDGASMCKHVAAVLYGVGARLDERPELLFRLRAVDENDLVADLGRTLPFSNRPLDAGKVLETDDVSALFGLDMEGAGGAMAANGTAPATSEPVDRTGRKRIATKAAGRKKVAGSRPAIADSDADTGIAQPSTVPKAPPAKRTSKSRSAGKATKTTRSSEPAEQTPSPSSSRTIRTAPRGVRDTAKRKTSKPEIELTPDGFVKWWK